jgi:AcrR family transcriptional regulator
VIYLYVQSNQFCEGVNLFMCPRPYRAERRKEAAQQTRARIITAARELLSAGGGLSGFTVDAVASQAGVARMTVYYQFGSKGGLLEALFDDLAARGLVERLRPALCLPVPLDALDGLVAAFAGFWASDRLVLRRVRALAALDPDFEQAVRARDERRREHLRTILGRLRKGEGRAREGPLDKAVDVLHTLTSFEFFDGLAGTTSGPEEVVALVRRLARAALGLDNRTTGRPRPRGRRAGRPAPPDGGATAGPRR